jgi:hypothetical protein
MIDPDNITPDTTVTADLPKLIEADDYHDFRFFEQIYHDIGLDVIVEEVGFLEGRYIGLVHTGTPAHNQLANELANFYRDLEDEEA